MNPPPAWSKLEALARTAFLLFVASFVGALMFTGGEPPTTWAGWRPILATALGAAIAQELVWLRSQLAALVVPTPPGSATTPAPAQTITDVRGNVYTLTPTSPANLSGPRTPGQAGFARLHVLAALSLAGVVALVGCSWWASSGKAATTTAATDIASCVVPKVLNGETDPGILLAECDGATLAGLDQVLLSLVSYYDTAVPAVSEAGVPLGVAAVRASHPPAPNLRSAYLPPTISLAQALTCNSAQTRSGIAMRGGRP